MKPGWLHRSAQKCRDRHFDLPPKKLGTSVAILIALLLPVQAGRISYAQPSSRLPASPRQHTVTLTWKASVSPVVGYNIYRKTKPESDYVKINSSPVPGLTYTDKTVESGMTYHYMVRAVDNHGHESVNSGEFTVQVP